MLRVPASVGAGDGLYGRDPGDSRRASLKRHTVLQARRTGTGDGQSGRVDLSAGCRGDQGAAAPVSALNKT